MTIKLNYREFVISMSNIITVTNAPVIQAWAESITAGIALCALLFAAIQILLIGAAHRRETLRRRDNAESLWREYEIRCF
jgi:hypothetical protein